MSLAAAIFAVLLPFPAHVRAQTFPAVTAYSLAKTKVSLPQDFGGKLNLLLLSFEREQQKDVDTWMPLVHDLKSANPNLRAFMFPVFPHENMLYRWWLALSLRGDVKAPGDLAFTMPLYLNKERFRQELQIPTEQEIVVLLVDKQGHVLWRTDGPLDDKKKAAVSAFAALAGVAASR